MEYTNRYIGTASWSIPKIAGFCFPATGSHLHRYAKKLNAVEINSSFYRHHQEKTYIRWSESVPDHFRFSVKLYRGITHDQHLDVSKNDLRIVLSPILAMKKLSVILVQLPKSVPFNEKICSHFLENLRSCYSRHVVFEPRHPSWGTSTVYHLFKKFKISQVIADPRVVPPEDPRIYQTGRLVYYRLHGSPVMYQSDYSTNDLNSLSRRFETHPGIPTWCIFDNTTFGYATLNAYRLLHNNY